MKNLTTLKDDEAQVTTQAARRAFDAGDTARRYAAENSVGSEPCVRFWNGEWHRWNGRAYCKLSSDEVKKRILDYLRKNACGPVTRTSINAVVEMLRLTTLVEGTAVPCWLSETAPRPADEIVAARNGLLHLPSLLRGRPRILPHTPAFFTLSALNYDYQANATCPRWEDFLRELWENDVESIRTLQEWCGYLLLPDTRQQKLLMLVGPTRSGKGTIARVIRKMLGETNVASPMMRSLAGDFGLWGMVGKTLAIVPDASLNAVSGSLVELIKSLTGEDALDIDRKNLSPLSSVALSARLMIIANQLPTMSDPSGALAQRLLILETRRSWAGKEDKELTDKLSTELPGILCWAIAGWRRLCRRGHFAQPKSSQHLVHQYGCVPALNGKQQVRSLPRLATNPRPSVKAITIRAEFR